MAWTNLLNVLDRDFHGMSFINLVDFDALYGHRRDPIGYGDALEAFDARLPEVFEKMNKDDLLIITADQGMIQLIKEQTILVNMYRF